MHLAAGMGSPNVIKEIAKHNPDLSIENKTGQIFSEYNKGDNPKVTAAIKKVTSPIKEGLKHETFKELVDAIRNDDPTALNKVIKDNNIDINYQDSGGNTMLHMAAVFGSPNAMKELAEHVPNLNLKNNEQIHFLKAINPRDEEMKATVEEIQIKVAKAQKEAVFKELKEKQAQKEQAQKEATLKEIIKSTRTGRNLRLVLSNALSKNTKELTDHEQQTFEKLRTQQDISHEDVKGTLASVRKGGGRGR